MNATPVRCAPRSMLKMPGAPRWNAASSALMQKTVHRVPQPPRHVPVGQVHCRDELSEPGVPGWTRWCATARRSPPPLHLPQRTDPVLSYQDTLAAQIGALPRASDSFYPNVSGGGVLRVATLGSDGVVRAGIAGAMSVTRSLRLLNAAVNRRLLGVFPWPCRRLSVCGTLSKLSKSGTTSEMNPPPAA